MDAFNSVKRLDRIETEGRHNHLDIFREFLDHLGRVPRDRGDKPAPDQRCGPSL